MSEADTRVTQTPPDNVAVNDRKARALELFQQSSALYQQGEFQQAAELLEKAHAIFPEPVLLYNLARAYEGLGEFARAVAAYEQYLDEDPATTDRGAIKRRLQTLREQLRTRPASAQPASAATHPRSRPVLPWVVSGLGLAALGTSGGLWLWAEARHQRAKDEADVQQAQRAQNQATRAVPWVDATLIGGGALALSGVIWLLLAQSTGAPKPSLGRSVEIQLGPTSAAFVSRF